MNQVDHYISSNPTARPGVYTGDAVRKRLQGMYRNHLDDSNNIYSCYK